MKSVRVSTLVIISLFVCLTHVNTLLVSEEYAKDLYLGLELFSHTNTSTVVTLDVGTGSSREVYTDCRDECGLYGSSFVDTTRQQEWRFSVPTGGDPMKVCRRELRSGILVPETVEMPESMSDIMYVAYSKKEDKAVGFAMQKDDKIVVFSFSPANIATISYCVIPEESILPYGLGYDANENYLILSVPQELHNNNTSIRKMNASNIVGKGDLCLQNPEEWTEWSLSSVDSLAVMGNDVYISGVSHGSEISSVYSLNKREIVKSFSTGSGIEMGSVISTNDMNFSEDDPIDIIQYAQIISLSDNEYLLFSMSKSISSDGSLTDLPTHETEFSDGGALCGMFFAPVETYGNFSPPIASVRKRVKIGFPSSLWAPVANANPCYWENNTTNTYIDTTKGENDGTERGWCYSYKNEELVDRFENLRLSNFGNIYGPLSGNSLHRYISPGIATLTPDNAVANYTTNIVVSNFSVVSVDKLVANATGGIVISIKFKSTTMIEIEVIPFTPEAEEKVGNMRVGFAVDGQSFDDIQGDIIVLREMPTLKDICPTTMYRTDTRDNIVVIGSYLLNTKFLQSRFTADSKNGSISLSPKCSFSSGETGEIQEMMLCERPDVLASYSFNFSISTNGQQWSNRMDFRYELSATHIEMVNPPLGDKPNPHEVQVIHRDDNNRAFDPPGRIRLLDDAEEPVGMKGNHVSMKIKISPDATPETAPKDVVGSESPTLDTGPEQDAVNSVYRFDSFRFKGYWNVTYNLTVEFEYDDNIDKKRSIAFGRMKMAECSQSKTADGYDCVCKKGYQSVSTLCEQCSTKSYKPRIGDFGCDACPDNTEVEKLASTKKGQCVCSQGYYDDNHDERAEDAKHHSDYTADCVQCSSEALCDAPGRNRYNIKAKPGYWRSNNIDLNFYECTTEGCRGGIADNSCKPGYRGPLCAKCVPGRVRMGEYCTECPPLSWSIIIFSIFVLLALVLVIFLAITLGSTTTSFITILRIVASHLQDLGILSEFNFPWSSGVQRVLVYGSNFAFNIRTLLQSLFCNKPISWETLFFLQILSPFFLFALAVLVGSVILFVRHLRSRRTGKVRKATPKVFYARIFVVVLYVLYPFVGIACFFAFCCMDIDGKSYLIEDTEKRCGGSSYNLVVGCAIACIVTYIVGFPIISYFLSRKDAKIVEEEGEEQVMDSCGAALSGSLRTLLTRGYRPERWFFELGLMSRKMIFVCLAMVSNLHTADANHDRLIFNICVLFAVTEMVVFLSWQIQVSPHPERYLNVLHGSALFVLFISMLMGNSLKNNTSNSKYSDTVTVFTLLLNGTLILFSIGLFTKRVSARGLSFFFRNRRSFADPNSLEMHSYSQMQQSLLQSNP